MRRPSRIQIPAWVLKGGVSARLAITLALVAGSLAPAAHAGTPTGDGDGGFTLTSLGHFDTPIDADNAPGFPTALFVAEKGGRIVVLKNGVARTALDLSARIDSGGEQGLLAIAFHPGYRRNRILYAYFTDNDGDNELVEFRAPRRTPLVFNPNGRLLFKTGHLFDDNHNGGELQFGPDGLLYLSTGDGGGGGDVFEQAQNRNTLLGKLLRLDPRKVRRCPTKRARRSARRRGVRCGKRARPYTSPRGNPFSGETPGRNEVYALGLRNPFRFSFDSLNGAISIGDVGQGCREEINYRRLGRARAANFGWARFEGDLLRDPGISVPGAIGPIHDYDNTNAAGNGCPLANAGFDGTSVIAGLVVRDPRLGHQYGRLLYGDAARSQIRTLIPAEGGASDDQATGISVPGSPFSFAEGVNRTVYVIDGSGPVFRLDPA